MMQGQAAQMSRLLDGLLDIARIDQGKIHLDLKHIDLVTLIRQSIELHSHQIERHRLRIDTHLPNSPIPIMGDETRIAQIFSNLLSNAVKFTPDLGEIKLHAALEDERARVRISDNGIGIAEEARSRIFTVFGQARQKTRMNSAGLGIGLALVKRLVELHGGTVSMESAGENQGTAFTLDFPAVKQSLPIAIASSDAALPEGPLRILLVEDNQVEARLLSALLQAAGHQVTIAGDGETALAMTHELKLDTILCDIDLPGELSGLEVARAVRATGDSRPGLVALSGYGREEDKQRSAEAGFDEHLTKPASRDTIINALLKAVALRNSRPSSTQ
jgi:CheY-like chemotaxis protein